MRMCHEVTVMLYLDDVPHVEVGVELRQPCPLTGAWWRPQCPPGPAGRSTGRIVTIRPTS
jgi:hypothetical protein